MGSAPTAPSTLPSSANSWLLVLRTSALIVCFLRIIWGPLVAPEGRWEAGLMMSLRSPYLFLYLIVVALLWSRKFLFGATLASLLSLASLLWSGLIPLRPVPSLDLALRLLYAIAHVAVLFSAFQLYTFWKSQPPALAQRRFVSRRVLWLLGIAVVLLGVAIVEPWKLLRRRLSPNETSAVGSLRTLNSGAVTYYTTYGNGYPPNLDSFGPPPEGSPVNCNYSSLVDDRLAKAERSGYRFFYLPGKPVETAGPGCDVPGVESYSVLARPVQFGQRARRNYFTDQTGTTRFTDEDRAATCNDGPIPIQQALESRSTDRLHIDNPVGGLLQLHYHARSYKTTYLNGYPSDLQSLGPPAEIKPLSCDDASLRFGSRWRDPGGVVSGYHIEYRPGPPVETPGPCCSPGAVSFSALARPVRWTPRRRNYYVDQTGVVRSTEEDREATADDPTIDLKRGPLW